MEALAVLAQRNVTLRHLSPQLFWLYTQPVFFKYKVLKKLFFFKFCEPKYMLMPVIQRKFAQKHGKFQRKPFIRKKIIKWFHLFESSRKFLVTDPYTKTRTVRFKKWYKWNLIADRQLKIRRKFLKLLKIKIHRMQILTGAQLFNTNKKHNLKKLFSIFRNSKNVEIVHFFFLKKFFFFDLFRRTSLKYFHVHNILGFCEIFNSKATYINLLNLILFRVKKKDLKLKYKIDRRAYYGMYRKRKWKFRKKRGASLLRRRFFKVKLYRLLLKTSITHRDILTSTYFSNFSSSAKYFYYINFILNIWNIRSYNWKQIT